jgi:hypothetical protein
VLGHSKHPRIIIRFLDRTDVIVKRVPPIHRPEFVYPVLFGALKHSSNRLNEGALVSLPYFLAEMDGDTARRFIDRVVWLLDRTSKETVAARAVSVLELAIVKLGAQAIVDLAIPVILAVWRREHWPLFAPPVVTLLYNLDAPVDTSIGPTVSLVADMLSYRQLHPMIQARLIMFVARVVRLLKVDHEITPQMIEAVADYAPPPPGYPTAPFEPPPDPVDGTPEEAEFDGHNEEEEEAPPAPASPDHEGSDPVSDTPRNSPPPPAAPLRRLPSGFSQERESPAGATPGTPSNSE